MTDQLQSMAASIEDFDRVMTTMSSIVGSGHVLREQSDLDAFQDPFAFSDGPRSTAVVSPGSAEEVQAVVALATSERLPLWTVSIGKNYGYGGASPRVDGSVVLDLHRMNHVLEVNEECGYAIVEPGVSFLELAAHLRDIGSALMPSVPDIGWGSVIGNALERGFGYTPHGDHSAFICGLEVVLADGTLIRTGMGAQTDNAAWALYKGGFGPSLEGLFLQSNLGVVTKMGVWLMPRPERFVVCMINARSDADLAPIIDTLRPLLLDGTIQSNVVIGNTLVIASMIAPRAAWYQGEGLVTDEAVRGIEAAMGLGRWNARFALYGPESLTQARLDIVRAAVDSALPDAGLVVTTYPGEVDPATVHPADRAQLGIPSTDLIQMAAWRGGRPAHTDFNLVCPPTGRDAVAQQSLIRRRVEEFGFDYAGGFTLNSRHAIALALVSFDADNVEERAQVKEMFPKLIADAAAQGYAPYRSHLDFMDLTGEQYDFNNHALRRVHGMLKDALDPAGVLSPGKQGVWPGTGSS